MPTAAPRAGHALVALLAIGLTSTSCSPRIDRWSPDPPRIRVAADEQRVLARGDAFERDGHRVRYLGIVSDARCHAPPEGMCAVDGPVRVAFEIESDGMGERVELSWIARRDRRELMIHAPGEPANERWHPTTLCPRVGPLHLELWWVAFVGPDRVLVSVGDRCPRRPAMDPRRLRASS